MLPAVRLDLRPLGCVDFSSTTMPSSSSWRMTIAANTKRESSSAGGQPDLTLRLRARSALRWPRRAQGWRHHLDASSRQARSADRAVIGAPRLGRLGRRTAPSVLRNR